MTLLALTFILGVDAWVTQETGIMDYSSTSSHQAGRVPPLPEI